MKPATIVDYQKTSIIVVGVAKHLNNKMKIENKIYTNNLKLIFGDFIKELQEMQKKSLKDKTTNK